MYYVQPVVRPPSEAYSLLIQATVGCSRPTCKFCLTSLKRNFRIRPLKEIENDLRQAQVAYENQTTKLFLLASNALIMKTNDLVAISTLSYRLFPKLRRIALYAHPVDILRKTESELQEIREAGLGLLYIGLESGNDKVLKFMRKGLTKKMSVDACLKAIDAGFQISCQVILGLGGKELYRENAIETGDMISRIAPHFVGALTLLVVPGTELEKNIESRLFELLGPSEALEEMRLLVQNTNILDRKCFFRSNHPSNYLEIGGTLPGDQAAILQSIDQAVGKTVALREELLRAL